VSRRKEISYTKKGRRANWIGHMRGNCFLKYIIGGTVEGKGGRGRRYK